MFTAFARVCTEEVSGLGKTTLLRNMIVADIASGDGVTVVDPKRVQMASLTRSQTAAFKTCSLQMLMINSPSFRTLGKSLGLFQRHQHPKTQVPLIPAGRD